MKSWLLFLLIAPLAAFAQNAKIDSLKRVIATTKVDTVRGRTLCRLCGVQRLLGDFADAQQSGTEGLRIARKSKDVKGQAECLRLTAIAHWFQAHDSVALALLKESIDLHERIKDKKGSAYSQIIIGNIYAQQGNYAEGLANMLKAAVVLEQIEDIKGAGSTYNNIGIIYRRLGQFDKAILHFRKAQSFLKDSPSLAATLHNIGLAYDDKKQIDSAYYYHSRSLDIQEILGNKSEIAGCLNSIGQIHQIRKDFEQALASFQRSREISGGIGDKIKYIASTISLAEIHRMMNKFGIARTYAKEALDISIEIDSWESIKEASKSLYRTDSALGDWKGAFEAHRIFKTYTDSLKNDEKSQEIGRIEAEYVAEKEREILKANQRAEIERYNWAIGSTVCGLVLMMALAFTFLRGRQREKKANSELRALNEEISHQKSEIEAQRDEISRQNVEILERNEEISKQNETLEHQRRQLSKTNEELADKNLRLKLAQEQLILEHEQREQAQRMAGIGEISTIVAHEVNTPLGAIKGGAQNLIDRLTQNASAPELQPLIERAALAQPLSSREERAALRKLEPLCENAGFAKPEEAARQLVNCGLHDLEDAETFGLLARQPQMLAQLANTGAFMAQAANIQRAAERAANIVSALKTYSTLAGGPSDENAGASVADTLGLVLKLYDYYLSQGIELKIDPMDGLPDVTLDAGALSQVWTKLLLNSIYGMNRKGKLEIKFIVTDRHLKILWLDNGPSPSNEVMARAFEPGVALRETDPPIDLWLCCAFVEGEAGGRIMASIPEDGGLVVELLLPKAD